ncbi:LANO_0H16270g1_1 [Lachancea nothofagi CBS 11611]|uniref:LANO_0H16270g1_1 n=1 Tax=Lachancea nothofagi CBS 11611 TaxID=1266666 RepID=A0A1G4KN36_9SACH|nr:LANO_0H16270g1_1 [Lachancea nothofagi CBS 11611]
MKVQSFSNPNLILHGRCYSSRASRRVKSRFDVTNMGNSNRSRDLLIQGLQLQVELGKLPLEGTQLQRAFNSLSQNLGFKKGSSSLQEAKKLIHLILQGKVSTTMIDEAWKTSFAKQEMVNVLEPNNERNFKVNRDRLADSDLLKIHPSTSREFHKTLDNLSPEMTMSRSSSANRCTSQPTVQSKDIDLNTLQTFLQTAERSKMEQRQFAWEQNRKYEWNNGNLSGVLSPGTLIFDNNNFTKRSKLSKLFQKTSLSSKSAANRGNQAPISNSVQLLIYDLEDDSKFITKWKNQKANLHIEYRDLFTVINGNNKSPEHLLKIITELENDNWQLIGDARADGSRKIVFQREGNESSHGSISSKIRNVSLLALLTGFTTYGVVQRRKRLESESIISIR